MANGYRAVAAASGPAALALLRDGLRPCLIVLDMMMPGMSGEEFRRAQLSDPAIADIPVILYSSGHEMSDAARRLGVSGHATKPRLQKLLGLVGTHC